MRKVLIIGANVGLTGCQMIRLQEASIVLNKAGVDLIEAVEVLQKATKISIIESDLELLKRGSLIEFASADPIIINEVKQFHWKEKKPKYIREQHKLAQRNYRRK